jgi:hypothetical protein
MKKVDFHVQITIKAEINDDQADLVEAFQSLAYEVEFKDPSFGRVVEIGEPVVDCTIIG